MEVTALSEVSPTAWRKDTAEGVGKECRASGWPSHEPPWKGWMASNATPMGVGEYHGPKNEKATKIGSGVAGHLLETNIRTFMDIGFKKW